jgi:hypothetical protein
VVLEANHSLLVGSPRNKRNCDDPDVSPYHEIGADTPVSTLTPERVQEYFDRKRVTKLRSGKAKAKPSIDKTRRVLRLAPV